MRRRDPRSAGTVGLLDAWENVAPIVSGLLGIPTEDEGRQMGLLDQAFLAAHASGDRRGMAEAIGQQAALYGPNMLGAGVIKAYHGSPHSFDAFKMDRIGTGEGAQAYGHGLYFAENEGVARNYRDALTVRNNIDYQVFQKTNASQLYAGLSVDDGRVLDDVFGAVGDIPGITEARARVKKMSPRAQELFEQKIAPLVEDQPGSMYEVNINANPDDFLDWDKPLSEQPGIARKLGVDANANVRRAADIRNRVAEDMRIEGRSVPDEIDQRNLDLASELESLSATGDASSYAPQSQEMLDDLKSKGIPGIKYFDGNSRGNGEGSRNYVVFDENLISIVKKYGIAGAVAAGLLTNEQAQAFMAQQDDQGAVNP